ncbi:hypothetical protein AFK49_008800 [Corynebacterium ulcerans]|nr:YbaN family protein [Corynebacterium ulcerans]OAG69700.1 hypothetical protein AFK49_008800 [Corynebacterium ulcerans]
MKFVLLTLGMLCVALGMLGVFLPILPTTPFLLAAAFFFARSSERFHHWLLNHRWFGPYLSNYYEGKMTPSHKARTLTLMWTGLLVSAFLVDKPVMWFVFICIGAAVSTHIVPAREMNSQRVN